MVVPRLVRRYRWWAAAEDRTPATSTTSAYRCKRRRSRTCSRSRSRSARLLLAVAIGFTALLAGTISSGSLAQIRWGERGLELSTEAAALTGLVLFGGVAAAVLELIRRNDRSGGVAEAAAAEDEGGTDVPEIFAGDTVEDAQVALVRDDNGDWTWRAVHLEALAERAAGAETRSAATDRVEHLQSVIESAGLREVPDAAIRLAADGDGSWRWTLVREDGREIAVAPTAYDDRDAAERAVSFLKDRGADADVVDLEGAALTITERDERWRWRLVDDERTPLAASPDAYERREDAEAAAERFAETVSDARVLEVETVGVELRSRSDADDGSQADADDGSQADADEGDETADENGDRWTWRLVDDADEVVGDATVAFDDRPTAEEAATTVLSALDEAAVTVADEAAYERYLESATGETGWRWRLTDATDRVVARAPAPLADRDAAERTAELFRETAPDADVLEIDDAAYEVYPAADSDTGAGSDTATDEGEIPSPRSATEASESDEDRAVAASDGGTETIAAASDGWRWRLVTEDRDVLATSPDPVADAETAETAIDRVRERARDAAVTAFETAAFRVYEDETGEWRWRLLDAGGTVLADSDAAHDSRNEAIEAMLTLKERAPDAEVIEIDAAEFELFEIAGGGWSWRLIDDAGRLVAAAPTSYPDRDATRAAVTRLRERLDAPVHTMERAAFQPVADGDADAWRWRYVLPTGESLAASATEYATRDELREHLSTVREAATTDRAHAIGSVTVQLRGGDAWRWRLLDRDRNPIAESAVAYPDRDAARAAVAELERVGADAPVFAIDDAAIRLERAEARSEDGDEADKGDDSWRWTLVDDDRNVLATATRPEPKSDLEATIDDVRRLAPTAEPVAVTGASFDLVEANETESGAEGDTAGDADDADWRWRLLDADGDPAAIGSNVATSKVAAHETIDEVRTLLEDATVIELEDAVFELYAADGETGDGDGDGDGSGTENETAVDDAWAWRLLDSQGETLLESTQTYESRTAAQRAIETLQAQLPDGRVTVAD